MHSQSADESARDDDDSPTVPGPVAPTRPASIWDKAKKALNDASAQATSASGALASKAVALGTTGVTVTAEATRGAVESGKQVYTGSKLESAINFIDGELDQRGAKKAIQDTTGAVVGKLDQVTGKRLLELLESKLRLQDEYNNVLATRLAEALERISKLEARLKNEY